MTDHKYYDILCWVCNYKGKPKADKIRNSTISPHTLKNLCLRHRRRRHHHHYYHY